MTLDNDLMEAESSFYERIIDIMIRGKAFDDLKTVNRLKIRNMVNRRMLLENRYEC